ncbi:chemotaxis protein CheW [Marinobacter sp. M-5]|uniref:chemotaxis protein CheW n=1 Tax=Marinobacter sp. M-5 TaxID=3081089 RepID=UPI00293CC25E|nr:chemotaxis protein CheW [Marinobacter sp. M-5]MDV3504202.1 chemotaxis protein CheW [Marinobacter sp. M-5]
MTTVEPAATAESLQVLSFVLDDEWFGVEISGIQEVLEYRRITQVPRTPNCMLGVINLRGKVIPVVDLRQHFRMQMSEPTIDSCIVIVNVEVDGENTPLGILTDRVQEVVELDAAEISPAPRIGNRIDSQFIEGMAKYDDHFIILLRLSEIFSSDELELLISGSERQPQARAEHAME